MNCKIFKFCQLLSHKDLFACRMARDAYYGEHTGRELLLVCPTCLTLCHQEDDHVRFYQMHGQHLGKLNVGDKSLAIMKAQINEMKVALADFVTPGLPAIPRPTKFLDNTDLRYGAIPRKTDGPRDFVIPSIVDVFLKSQRGQGRKRITNPSTSVGPLEAAMPSTSAFQPSVDVDMREEESTSVGPLEAAMPSTSAFVQPSVDLDEIGPSPVKRIKRNSPKTVQIKNALNSSHVVLTIDVSDGMSPVIQVPASLSELLAQEMRRMGHVKIQFGVQAEYTNISQEKKTWITSNKAIPFSDTFIEESIAKLSEKLSKFTEQSSGWTLTKIMEIEMTLIKYEEVINRSGRSYIPTPYLLRKKDCTVNVINHDNKCFLYSVLAIHLYDTIPNVDKERVESYQGALSTLKYDEAMFPMKLANISKFENDNNLAINVLQWNETPKERSVHYKHPNVEIVRRSKRDGPQLYLCMIEDGANWHYVAVNKLNVMLNVRMQDVRVQSLWCDVCLHGFKYKNLYLKHKASCRRNVDPTTLYTMPEHLHCKFQDWSKTVKKPYLTLSQ